MEPLSYQTPPTSPQTSKWQAIFVTAVIAVEIVVNGALVGSAAADRSWGALHIMLLDGPLTNGLAMVVFLAFIPLLRKISAGASVFGYVLTAIFVPLIAIAIDAACILSMHLHGC